MLCLGKVDGSGAMDRAKSGLSTQGRPTSFRESQKESMDYPQEFSAQARARVEAERLKAGRDLENIRKQPQVQISRRRS